MKLVSKNFKITLTLPMLLLTLPLMPLLPLMLLLLLPKFVPMLPILRLLLLNIKAVLIIGSNNMKGLTRS